MLCGTYVNSISNNQDRKAYKDKSPEVARNHRVTLYLTTRTEKRIKPT